MLQNMIDDVKNALSAAAQTSGVVAASVFTAFVTLCFLCAAAFVFVLDRYGLIMACLCGAGVFFVVTLFLLVWLDALKRRAARPKEVAKSAMQTAIADPMVIAAGLQLVRVVGIKRMIPLVALGGLALGLLARAPKREISTSAHQRSSAYSAHKRFQLTDLRVRSETIHPGRTASGEAYLSSPSDFLRVAKKRARNARPLD